MSKVQQHTPLAKPWENTHISYTGRSKKWYSSCVGGCGDVQPYATCICPWNQPSHFQVGIFRNKKISFAQGYQCSKQNILISSTCTTHMSQVQIAEVCMKIIYKINDMELMYHSRLFVSLNSGNIKQSRGSKFQPNTEN